MLEIERTEQLELLLASYETAGGVIEHVFIDPGESDRPRPDVHRDAALLTLASIGRATDKYFEQLLATPEYSQRPRDDFFRLQVNPDLLTGRTISPDEFVGPRWDRRQRRLASRNEMAGYAYAFLDPPYTLYDDARGSRFSEADLTDLFCSVTDALFGGFPDSLTVYEWSPDCSNYFNDGREWWGRFFWTVESPDSGQIIGVAASATD